MDEPLTIREDVVIPASEMWFTASRSGGPGGQHVNTTSSRVTLYWHIATTTALTAHQKARVMRRLSHRIFAEGVLHVDVDTARSQHRNRQEARERLAELVREALLVPKKRLPTAIPKRAKQRRLKAKLHRRAIKIHRATPSADD